MRAKHDEPHADKTGTKLNWLRASVLGANDGIVSVSALLVGLAAAGSPSGLLFTVGVAAIIANALSMAVGEYVSVSSQRDTEKALLEKERVELRDVPEHEVGELATLYEKKGLSKATAQTVAKELTARDAFAAHVDVELGIDPNNLTNPWQAGLASAIAFTIGGVIPLVAILLPPEALRLPAAFIATFIALVITGTASAQVGGANKMHATIRVVLGGIIAMIITFAIGKLFGVSGI
jgi:VIT1/CCC1 family predicted Fe2+/Mn2+ transporter